MSEPNENFFIGLILMLLIDLLLILVTWFSTDTENVLGLKKFPPSIFSSLPAVFTEPPNSFVLNALILLTPYDEIDGDNAEITPTITGSTVCSPSSI